MTHIDEKTIELYVLGAVEATKQADAIRRHLQTCQGCAALHRQVRDFYQEVEQGRRQRQESQPQALTLRSMIVRAPWTETGLARAQPSLPARALLFVLRRPVASSLGLAALLAGAALLVIQERGPSDTNPAYARARSEFLVAYNGNGEELWRKHIGFGYDYEKIVSPDLSLPPEQAVTTLDVDGDGKNEVLATFGWQMSISQALGNALTCFRADGSERWSYRFHRQMRFGKESYNDEYRLLAMMAGDFDRDGTPEIVAIARHFPLWPTAIVRLNAKTGDLLSEYWHPGWTHSAGRGDIENDGAEELIFVGENNSLNRASIAVFDARFVEGYAPAVGRSFVPPNLPAGREKYYILLPQTDLQDVASHPRNYASQVSLRKDGSLEVTTQENFLGRGFAIFFYFDSSLSCTRVIPSDQFVSLHRQLEKEGKLTEKVDNRYADRLRMGVQYWDGEKFVKEPTMNRRYLEHVAKQPL